MLSKKELELAKAISSQIFGTLGIYRGSLIIKYMMGRVCSRNYYEISDEKLLEKRYIQTWENLSLKGLVY